MSIDRSRLRDLLAFERAEYARRNPRSRELYDAGEHLFGRVPMTWMNKAAGGFPLGLDRADGARVWDLDGHEYIDFCLGDTGAMAGHSPAPVVAAVAKRFGELGGATAMMPTQDAEWVAAELSSRFGVDRWSFSLTATDANRWVLRLVRAITGRPKILFHSYCYHGSVDESLIVCDDSFDGADRPGNVGAPVEVTRTSRVAEFNDLKGLEKQLAQGDVAAMMMEPALTNIGLILPEPGYLDGVRELTERYGVLLVNDETHTFSAGVGGATRAWGLKPDIVTIGKAIGGGIPIGAYGISSALAESLLARSDLDLIDMGGVGGTLAGNALSLAAARATLSEVLTADAFSRMTALASSFTRGVQDTIDRTGVPWSIAQLGARAEYRFVSPAPRNGSESVDAYDADLEDFLHVFLANRGVLMTPFHNMALMCPVTTEADVVRHTELFAEAVDLLVGPAS